MAIKIAGTTVIDDSRNLTNITNINGTSVSDYATEGYVDDAITNLVDSSPAALDTLNELAAALGDDPNFATTVSTNIGGKVSKSGDTMSGTLVVGQIDSGNPAAGTDDIRVSGFGILGNRGTFYVTNPGAVQIGVGSAHNNAPAMTFTSSQNTSLKTLYENSNRVFTDGYHPNADAWTTARTLSLTGDVTGSVSWDGSGNASLSTTVGNDSHNHDHSDGSFDVNGQLIGGLGAVTSGGTTNWNDSTNARAGMGHTLLLGTHTNGPGSSAYFHPVSFEYNSKDGSGNMTQFAIPYSGTDGPYFRSRYSNAWSSWLELWHSGNDGSGSGLDADLLDGQQGSYYYPASNPNGYTTNVGDITGVTAGSGLDGGGTSGTVTLSIESDLRGEVFYIGRDTNDYIGVETTQINFVLDGATDMRLYNTGDLHVEGNVIAYSTTISDKRLKTDIVKIDSALDKVDQINGYTFTYTADGKKSAGVIAQEVEKVLPSAITESKLPLKMGEDDDTEYKTVQYDQLIGLLVEAVKELKAEVAELRSK